MREFFKGWKHKLGVLTLGLACVLMAGWVRSHSIHDAFVMPTGNNSAIQMVSACRSFGFMTIQTPASEQDIIPFSWESKPCQGNRTILRVEVCKKRMPQSIYRVESGIELSDMRLGHSQVGTRRISATYYLLPYWWIILSVTLISAPLLLVKPRPASPMKTSERSPAEER